MTYNEILKDITEHCMTIAVAQEIANILYKAQEKIDLLYYLEIIDFNQFQFETDRITHLLTAVGVDRDDI